MFLYTLAIKAGDTTKVPYKDWWEYTDEEKQVLRDRWTDKKVDAVVTAVKEQNQMPEFVSDLDTSGIYSVDGRPWIRHDLRGIPLFGEDLSHAVWWVPNLQGADLRAVNLKKAHLEGANLQGANLKRAELEGTFLAGSMMQESNLEDAKLRAADLRVANLDRAYLLRTNLDSSNLEHASMQGAMLKFASLDATNVFRVRFDSTYVSDANLGRADNLTYVIWGDSIEHRYVIGEEIAAMYIAQNAGLPSQDEFRAAEIAYRELKSIYEKEFLYEVAAEFHFRENEVITKRLLRNIERPWVEPWDMIHGVTRYLFLRLTYGYGSRPWWLLRYAFGVVFLFALAFYVLSLFSFKRARIYFAPEGDPHRSLVSWKQPHECLFASLLFFGTVGYTALKTRQWLQFFRLKPVEYELVGWVRILVGLEAALGIWVLALLVTVLFGK